MVDLWARVGVVCGALLAAGAVAFKAWRGLVRVWHTLRKVNAFLDDVKAAGGPAALVDRLEGIEASLNEHLQWHGHPGQRSAQPVRPYANGDRPGGEYSGPRHRR